jgi:3-hydroxybutyryl-CoA dehydratase
MPETYTRKVYLEDYHEGERWVTPGRTLTETDIINYAGLTGDWHPIHTDAEYARGAPFGERIAHGLLVLAVGSTLIFRLGEYVVFPKTFIAFYGMDAVRFVGPVKIGDTLHCEAEVTALEVKDEKRGILVCRNAIKNQRGEDVVVYDTRALVGRRPAENRH